MKIFALLSIVLVLSGCASTSRYPTDPGEQLDYHARYADEYANEGKHGVVAYHLFEMMSKPGGQEQVKSLLRTHNTIKRVLTHNICASNGTVSGKEDLVRYMRLMRELEAKGLWGEPASCVTRLNDLATQHEHLKWTVEDDIWLFESLSQDVLQEKILQDSMDHYQSKSWYPSSANHIELAKRYNEYVAQLGKLGQNQQSISARKYISEIYCSAIRNTSSIDSTLGLMQGMILYQQSQPGEIDRCIGELDESVADRISTGQLKLGLTEDVGNFKTITRPDVMVRRIINTFGQIKDGDNKEAAREAIKKALSSIQHGSLEYRNIEEHLRQSEYPPRVLKVLEPFFPDVAGSKLQELRTGAKATNAKQSHAFTTMLEGCAAITDQQKKSTCFESVMEMSKRTPEQSVAAPYTKFDGIKRAATALKSATGVGVSLIQYMPYVRQLATEVEMVKAMNNSKYEVDALAYYEKAIEAYQDAYTFWDAWIDFYARRDNKTSYFGGLPFAQTNVGWIVQKYSVPTTNADLLGIWRGVTQSAALGAIWRKAEEFVAMANEDL